MHGWFLHLGLCFPVVMYGCERWTVKKAQLSFSALSGALKNCCFWTVVLEKTLENPLNCKEIQPVHSEGDQPWDFFGRNDANAETPVLWPPHAKSWLIGKDSDAGRDWGQEEKGTTEDEMAGWHHWLDGRESEWTLGVGDGQGGLVCCDSWVCKESDTTEWLNWLTELEEEVNWFALSAYCFMAHTQNKTKNLGAEWRHVGNTEKREDERDERRERPGQLASDKSLWVKVSHNTCWWIKQMFKDGNVCL